MNETIINNWNNVVKEDDTVCVLGDMFMGKITDIESIFSRLNGHITLIRGNHDTLSRINEYKRLGVIVKDIGYIEYKGKFFILCHFPMSEEFARMICAENTEIIICYGHVHSNAPKGYYNGTYHVGVDTNNLTPVNIETIWKESLN